MCEFVVIDGSEDAHKNKAKAAIKATKRHEFLDIF